jgi:ChrR Cupin-like domain
MAKPIVFITPEELEGMEWQPFADGPEGMWEKVLARDEETGSYTRLIRADPDLVVAEVRVHDFWEESYILEGSFEEDGVTYGPGTFVCNPPGYEHGPYTSPSGWLALEWVYYERS